jgi:hypothetical protein
VFGNRVLRIIYEPSEEEVGENYMMRSFTQLYNLQQILLRGIKSLMMKWVGNMGPRREMGNFS